MRRQVADTRGQGGVAGTATRSREPPNVKKCGLGGRRALGHGGTAVPAPPAPALTDPRTAGSGAPSRRTRGRRKGTPTPRGAPAPQPGGRAGLAPWSPAWPAQEASRPGSAGPFPGTTAASRRPALPLSFPPAGPCGDPGGGRGAGAPRSPTPLGPRPPTGLPGRGAGCRGKGGGARRSERGDRGSTELGVGGDVRREKRKERERGR